MSSWELCKDEWERKLQAARKEVEVARARLEAHRRKVALERQAASRDGGSCEKVSDVSKTSPVDVESVPAPLVPSAQSALPVSSEHPVRACDRGTNAFEQAESAGGDTVSPEEVAGGPTTAPSEVDREPEPLALSSEFSAPDSGDLPEIACGHVAYTLELADPTGDAAGDAVLESEAEERGSVEPAAQLMPLAATCEPAKPAAELESGPLAPSRELVTPAGGVPQEGIGYFVRDVCEFADATRDGADEPPVEGELGALGSGEPVAPSVAPHFVCIPSVTRPSAKSRQKSPRPKRRARKTALSSGTKRGQRRRSTGHVARKSSPHHFAGKGVKSVAAPDMADRMPPSKKPQLIKVGQGDAPSFKVSSVRSPKVSRKHGPDKSTRGKAQRQFRMRVVRFCAWGQTQQPINGGERFCATRCLAKSELWLFGS